MEFSEDEIRELKSIAPDLSIAQEGGFTYIRINNLRLPEHCKPNVINALLCPMQKDGYMSRLFFSEKPTSKQTRNWNAENVRILGENWFAISWQTQTSKRLVQMLLTHLNALE